MVNESKWLTIIKRDKRNMKRYININKTRLCEHQLIRYGERGRGKAVGK